MDLFFQIVFAFFIFVFMFVKLLKIRKTRSPRLPPGPWKLPIIGSIHHLGSSLPHQRFRDLARKYGPLMHLQLGQVSVVVVSSPETAKEVMKTHDLNFADRPDVYAVTVFLNGAKNISFAPHGDYWRRIRRICSQELLSPMKVQSFWSTREEEVSKFIKSIGENVGSPVDISERIFSLTYGITGRATFGKKCKDQEAFIELVKEITSAAAGFNISDLFPSSTMLPIVTGFKAKLEKIRERFFEVTLDNIIEEHKAKKAATNVGDENEDLVDVLLRFQERGEADFPLPTANIKAVILVCKFSLIEFPCMTFALPNIELPLIKMLYHFDWKLPDGTSDENLDMNESFGLTIKRKENLKLIPIAYYPFTA